MDALLRTIASIYDAAIAPSEWEATLDNVCGLIGAAGFNVFLLDHHTGLVPFNTSVGIPDDVLSEYNAHYVTKDPGIEYFVRNPGREFYFNYLHTAEEEIDAHEYYAWLQRAGGARYYLAKTFNFGPRFSGIASAQRSKDAGHAQQPDFDMLGTLAPHLERAVHIDQLFKQVDLRVAAAYDALERLPHGVILLGRDANALFLNQVARATIARADGLSLAQGRVAAMHAADDRRLQPMIREAIKTGLGDGLGSGGSLSVSRPDGRPAYAVQVLPLAPSFRLFTKDQPMALILVGDPDRNLRLKAEELAALYGLTMAEARIARLLAEGRRPAAVCRLEDITENTLKTHRKRIFAKLGVETQAQLARLLNAV